MTEVLINASRSLKGMATSLENAVPSDQKFNVHLDGHWNSSPLSTGYMAQRARMAADRIAEIEYDNLSDDQRVFLNDLPSIADWFSTNSGPNLRSDFRTITWSFDSILSHVESILLNSKFLNWSDVKDSGLVPKDIVKKLKAIETKIEFVRPTVDNIESFVSDIKDAHAAVDALPADVIELRKAKDEVQESINVVRSLVPELLSINSQAKSEIDIIKAYGVEAKTTLERIGGAYSAATSMGLAASFDERARKLSVSTRWWVALLLLVLCLGGVIGYLRIFEFTQLAHDKVSDKFIIVHLLLSIASVAAPVWFAWLATKQISHRFRLSEDYAFKASVARAYEGYRKEATRIDSDLEKRLFSSALERLEEAPLRFVSNDEYGSPYESLLDSKGFQIALEKMPSFRDEISLLISSINRKSKSRRSPEIIDTQGDLEEA